MAMKPKPPTDLVDCTRLPALSARDRRRLVLMRRQAGAVQIRFTVSARPTTANGRWRPIHSATAIFVSHSALNAEQLIQRGPIAGRDFHAPTAILELFEQIHMELFKHGHLEGPNK